MISWGLGYQLAGMLPHRDRLRCATCRRWTRTYVLQGLDEGADDDATARRLCDQCAVAHRDILRDRCCTDDCCGPGSWCCSHANPHNHPELTA